MNAMTCFGFMFILFCISFTLNIYQATTGKSEKLWAKAAFLFFVISFILLLITVVTGGDQYWSWDSRSIIVEEVR